MPSIELYFCCSCFVFRHCSQYRKYSKHIFIINNYSTGARWIWVGYKHLISKNREWNNCFIKNTHIISWIVPDFTCKNNRFSACLKFWADKYSYHIWRAWRMVWWLTTMMAQPIRALELRYLMIQFLIAIDIPQFLALYILPPFFLLSAFVQWHLRVRSATHCLQCMWMYPCPHQCVQRPFLPLHIWLYIHVSVVQAVRIC